MKDSRGKKEISWKMRTEAIDKLRRTTFLSDWDKGFLNSVRSRIDLTPKQIETLNGIFHRETGSVLIDTGIDYPANWLTPRKTVKADDPYE